MAEPSAVDKYMSHLYQFIMDEGRQTFVPANSLTVKRPVR
jgi:hypothetical protein